MEILLTIVGALAVGALIGSFAYILVSIRDALLHIAANLKKDTEHADVSDMG